MKKKVEIEIIYSQSLCGQLGMDERFTWCPLVDSDLGQYCLLYNKQLKVNNKRYPYRCTQCRKRNKVTK